MCLTGSEFKFKQEDHTAIELNGQVYHAISQMQPDVGKKPSFSQIYIFDQDHQLEQRMLSFEQLDKVILKELQDMI